MRSAMSLMSCIVAALLVRASMLLLAAAQEDVVSSVVPLYSGQRVVGVLDVFPDAPSSVSYSILVSEADGIGSDEYFTPADLILTAFIYGGYRNASDRFVLLATDEYDNTHGVGPQYGSPTSPALQITSDSGVLGTDQFLWGPFILQLQAAPGYSGSVDFELIAQVQLRTELAADTATLVVLPAAFNNTFPVNTFAHVDFYTDPDAYVLLVVTESTDTTLSAPIVVWLPSASGDVPLHQLLQRLPVDWTDPPLPAPVYGAFGTAYYQLYHFAGDSTCMNGGYEHMLLWSQSTVLNATVLAHPLTAADAPTTLSSGRLQTLTMAALQLAYFSFTIAHPQTVLTVTVRTTSSSGNADLYLSPASVNPAGYTDQSSAAWAAMSTAALDVITVTPSDPWFSRQIDEDDSGRVFAISGQYFLTVVALRAGDYTLNFTLHDTTDLNAPVLSVQLNAAASVHSTVASSPVFYRFTVPALDTHSTTLVVSLDSTCADLYLSDTSSTPGPSSPTSAVHASTNPGPDVITLTGAYAELHPGSYWIGVAVQPGAATPCTFALTVFFDNRTNITAGVLYTPEPLIAGGIRYFDYVVEYQAPMNYRLVVSAGSSALQVLATSMQAAAAYEWPSYADPTPYVSSTFQFSEVSNGSVPALALLVYWQTGAVMMSNPLCQGAGGCYSTIAVYAPYGSGGIPSWTLELQQYESQLTMLVDGVPSINSLPPDNAEDLAYSLVHSTAACTITLVLLSFDTSGSAGVLLCVVKNLNESFVYGDSGLWCDWTLSVQPAVAVAAETFFATSPAVTGALPGYNNVGGVNMTGIYRMLAVSTGAANASNAEYSVTMACVPYVNTAAVINAPIVSGQSISQTIQAGNTAFFALDLSTVPINASADVSIYVSGTNIRLPGGLTPSIGLAYSQTTQQPAQSNNNTDFYEEQLLQVQALVNLASYSTLSSLPLYFSVAAIPYPCSGFCGSTGPLTFTVTTTVTLRVALTAGTAVTQPASPSFPFHWYTLLVPVTQRQASAVFSLVAANDTASPTLSVLSAPDLDANGLGDNAIFTRRTDPDLSYRAGGVIVFNNEACVAAAGSCRYSVMVFTPTPTAYALLASGVQASQPPASISVLTATTAGTGGLSAAGVAFYQFNTSVTLGSVTLTLTTLGGNADIFVGPGNGTGAMYADNAQKSLDEALWNTGGVGNLKQLSFTSAQLAPRLQGFWAVTVLAQTACSYTLSLLNQAAVTAPAISLPLTNKVQSAGSVGNTGQAVYSLQVDGTAGTNSDVTIVLQSDLSRAVPGVQSWLLLQVVTEYPFYATRWQSWSSFPTQPASFVLNSLTGAACSRCPPFDPTVSQTLYIVVSAVSVNVTTPIGGPFLLSATYAPRVALSAAGPSTYTAALNPGAVQMFTYLPDPSAVSPASFYSSVSTASAAAGAVGLFYSLPSGDGAAVLPYSQPTGASAFASISQPSIYVGDSCSQQNRSQCLWFFAVLVLSSSAQTYTFTITDPAVVQSIVPGVPTSVAFSTSGACIEAQFMNPIAHEYSNISLRGDSTAAASTSVFLTDSSINPLTWTLFPDSITASWMSNSIGRELTVTPNDAVFSNEHSHGSSSYDPAMGTAGIWCAVLCASAATTATLTVRIADNFTVHSVTASVNGPAVVGSVAMGLTAYVVVTVVNVSGSGASLSAQLSSESTSLVLYMSPSFYPGPTPTAPFTSFRLSPYELTVGYSASSASYPPLTIQPPASAGVVGLTSNTTYYIAVYNADVATRSWTLTVAGVGVNAAAPSGTSPSSSASAAVPESSSSGGTGPVVGSSSSFASASAASPSISSAAFPSSSASTVGTAGASASAASPSVSSAAFPSSSASTVGGSSKSSGLSSGQLAGAILGPVLAVLLLCAVIVVLLIMLRNRPAGKDGALESSQAGAQSGDSSRIETSAVEMASGAADDDAKSD